MSSSVQLHKVIVPKDVELNAYFVPKLDSRREASFCNEKCFLYDHFECSGGSGLENNKY